MDEQLQINEHYEYLYKIDASAIEFRRNRASEKCTDSNPVRVDSRGD